MSTIVLLVVLAVTPIGKYTDASAFWASHNYTLEEACAVHHANHCELRHQVVLAISNGAEEGADQWELWGQP